MAVLFFVMVVASLVKLTITAPNSVLATALAASGSGVELALTLAGIYIVWMGIIQIAIDSGIIDALGRLMSPVIRFLFGKQSDEVNALLATNISANMIGAGNAATPAAIQAIEKMSTPDMTHATMPMIMLFVLSATSLQILPTTVISILESHGAANASSVILPTFVTSTLTTVLGVILVKVFARKDKSDETAAAIGTVTGIHKMKDAGVVTEGASKVAQQSEQERSRRTSVKRVEVRGDGATTEGEERSRLSRVKRGER